MTQLNEKPNTTINHIGDANEKVLSIIDRLRAYARNQGGWHNIDDTCDEATDEITRLRAELAARDWQPIETAPKDVADVLLFCENSGERVVGFWSTRHVPIWGKPSHWMPLPSPPKMEAGK